MKILIIIIQNDGVDDEETQEGLPTDPANDPTEVNSNKEEDCDIVSETKSTKKPIAKPDQGKPRTKRQK